MNEEAIELLREIRDELRTLKQRAESADTAIRGIRVNWNHPLMKLVARGGS